MLEQNFLEKTEELTSFKDGADFRISGICKKHNPEAFPNEELLSKCLDLYTELATHQKLVKLIKFFDDDKAIYTDEVLTKLREINEIDPQMYYDIMKVAAFMLKVKDVNGEVDFSKRISDYLFEGTIAFLRNSGLPVTEVDENEEESTEPVFETVDENKNDDEEAIETVDAEDSKSEDNSAETEEVKNATSKKKSSKKDTE